MQVWVVVVWFGFNTAFCGFGCLLGVTLLGLTAVFC